MKKPITATTNNSVNNWGIILLILTLPIVLISIINNQAFAISGEEISAKVSEWLVNEGIKGIPVFSKKVFIKIAIMKLK